MEVGEEAAGPEICEGDNVRGGVVVELEVKEGGKGCGELSFEVEGGGAIGAPSAPELECGHRDAKGDEGGGASAAEGVKGKVVVSVVQGAADGLKRVRLEKWCCGGESGAAKVGDEKLQCGSDGAPHDGVGGLGRADSQVCCGETVGAESEDFRETEEKDEGKQEADAGKSGS